MIQQDIGVRALVGISMMDRPFFEALPFVEEEFESDLLEELRALPIASAGDLLELAHELAAERHPSINPPVRTRCLASAASHP